MTTTPTEPKRIKRVKLSQLTIEPAMQSRLAHIDPATVNRYRGPIKACDGDLPRIPFPPITAAQLGPQLYIIDGFHRYEAHRLEEVPSILCEIVEVGSLEEAQWLAAKSNLQHGKPMNRAEVRKAFQRFVAAKQHRLADPNASTKVIEQRPRAGVMTLGEIATVFGKSKSTVSGWFKEDFPKQFARLYSKDAERYEDRELGGVRSASALAIAPSTPELAEMSLANVERLGRTAANPSDRVRVTEFVAATLADLALFGSVEVANLTVTFGDSFSYRTAKVQVEVIDCPDPPLPPDGWDEESDF